MHGTSPKAVELFAQANAIVTDEVIAVTGKISGPFVMVKTMVWPDVPIKAKKQVKEDVAIAFISDMHIGSKLFMQDKFMRFINWLNGGVEARKELAGKVKYMVIAGDVVDGIGIYPKQARTFRCWTSTRSTGCSSTSSTRYPITSTCSCCRATTMRCSLPSRSRAYRRTMLDNFSKDNVHFVSNPCYLTLHGIEVLAYHGASLDSMIRAVPG